MKIKKSIVYLSLAIIIGGSFLFITKSKNLYEKLSEVELQRTVLAEKLNAYEQLVSIDSLLLKGEYDTAIKSYNSSVDFQTENKMGIPLRIALAEKLLHDRVERTKDGFKVAVDTLSKDASNDPIEIRKFDSINFTLKKTEVQLARLKQQLKQKSFGEYLKFKSKKGNQMHYVGQVKNGKANGHGIALLDTGSRYEGQWKDNLRQGEGTFYWPDGEYYVGTYENDKRSGFGTYYWPNGEKYAGQWKEDKRSGSGKVFSTDGDVVAGGQWSDDELVEVNER